MPFLANMPTGSLNSTCGSGRISNQYPHPCGEANTTRLLAATSFNTSESTREACREMKPTPTPVGLRCRPEQPACRSYLQWHTGHEWHIEDGKFGLQSDPPRVALPIRSRHTSLAATSLNVLGGSTVHLSTRLSKRVNSTERGPPVNPIGCRAVVFSRPRQQISSVVEARQDTYEGCFPGLRMRPSTAHVSESGQIRRRPAKSAQGERTG